MTPLASTGANPIDLLRMMDGLVIHQALYAAAKLGIADLLKEGERSASELAHAIQVNENALYRVLRLLAGCGVFHETAARSFANSPLSNYLRSDVPDSVRPILIFRGSRYSASCFENLLQSIATGMPAHMDVFERLRRNPEQGQIFDEAMGAISSLWSRKIAAAYDFESWQSLMDVGGGNGALLAAILTGHRNLRGILADQPQVLERARQRGFPPVELAGRVQLEVCDFFQAVPSGCRAFLLKNIVHDWDNERARRILLNCRRAIPDDGVLLLVEYSVGEANVPSLGKTLDLLMLTATGGKERTPDEHRVILADAGFRLNRAIPVSDEIIMIEALPK